MIPRVVAGDSLRAVLDSVFAAPAYRWIEQPDPWAQLRAWFWRATEWLLALRADHPAAFRAVVAGMCLVVAAVLAHAGYVLWRTARGIARPDDVARAEAAPERRDAEWYARAADAAAARGRHREALRLAFMGLTLRLDALGVVRWAAGKTPAEYARETGLSAADRERLGALVRALYRYIYAAAPCGPEDYARWRAAAAEPWHAAAG
ncbi:MAG TPA: DUF4129 domain-containing protein [Gemmatimonadales bacterium]|nr:DUF4129 domain-containing protein [Gemmatimonadales bacterium]